MRFSLKGILLLLVFLFVGTFVICYNAAAQSSASSGTIQGVVKDPSGAIVAGAKVEISNPVSGFHRETTTGDSGDFHFVNLPFNPYHLVVTAKGFAPISQDADVRSAVPISMEITVTVEKASTTITVASGGTGMQ